MKFRDPTTWGQTFLPKPKYPRMTWKRWLLLVFAIFIFVDQFFVHGYYNKSDEGILVLVLAFRAVSSSEFPIFVLLAGVVAALLTSATSHGLLRATSMLWIIVIGVLLLVVLFWHRRKSDQIAAIPTSAGPDPESALHLGDKRD
jgi:cellulose synthase/poly-beta-1,6-N-acetylglucosamine synthase-like glycosyltransferase